MKRVKLLVGASPHIDEFAANFPYICICHMLCRKLFTTLICVNILMTCRQSNGILDGVDKRHVP